MNGNWLDEVKWDAQGLVPVIAQELGTNDVLMFAFMNREALRQTDPVVPAQDVGRLVQDDRAELRVGLDIRLANPEVERRRRRHRRGELPSADRRRRLLGRRRGDIQPVSSGDEIGFVQFFHCLVFAD